MMKMDMPQSVQELLKCDECDELLSCGPVFVMHDTGETICGRCSRHQGLQAESENRDKTRNNKYEAAAKLLRFPCSYAGKGCLEKLDFSTEEPNNHELNCEFRTFICPLGAAGECDWLGSWKNLETHCRDKHISQMLENPSNLPKPNLTASNLRTYLISAFNFLFILHVKVCITSGKLFHSVRMFGDAKFSNNFSFNFFVAGADINFSKFGSVFPARSLTVQESTAICTKIKLLLEMLDGKYNESKFIIKIQVKKCFYCSSELKSVSDSKCCSECDGTIVKCKYHEDGCLFADYTKNSKKCGKHEQFLCKYAVKCFLCQMNFVGGSIFDHFECTSSCRKIIKHKIGTLVRITPNTSNYVDYILFSSENNCINFCTFMLKKCKLEFWLWTSLSSLELKKLKCSVVLIDPKTKYTQNITPQLVYNDDHDCFIDMKTDDFPSWENVGIDIKIDISAE